jgi:GTPase SAR1 family protein
LVFFNYTTMQMTAKIVYYGPGLCGKTTNLQYIHHKTDPGSRGEMVSLETEADRTLFFDLLPLEVGVIGGMKVRLQLYTVPGQVFYNTTRKLVLKGVDGIVFVADSQVPAMDANLESFNNLLQNLAEMNLSLDQVPFVFQFNKRDLKRIHSVETLNQSLNLKDYEVYEAAALHGVGVFETLKAISKKTLALVRRKIDSTGGAVAVRRPQVAVPVPASAASSPFQAVYPPAALETPEPPARLTHRAASDPPPASVPPAGSEEVKVEFAAGLDVTPSRVKIAPRSNIPEIATRSPLDVEKELDKLRRLARGGGPREGTTELSLARELNVRVPRRVLEQVKGLVVELKLETDSGAHSVPEPLRIELPPGAAGKLRLKIALDLEGEG